jgi:hypothetical protein
MVVVSPGSMIVLSADVDDDKGLGKNVRISRPHDRHRLELREGLEHGAGESFVTVELAVVGGNEGALVLLHIFGDFRMHFGRFDSAEKRNQKVDGVVRSQSLK